MNNLKEDRITAIILGHAIGDALAVPVEFCDRSVLIAHPVTDFRAFGTHHMPAGTWSDDTRKNIRHQETLDTVCHLAARYACNAFRAGFKTGVKLSREYENLSKNK